MADKKFSEFSSVASPTGAEEVVGLSSGNNVRLTISDIDVNTLDGTLNVGNGGTGATSAGVSTVGALLDEGSQVIGTSLVIADDGAGNSVLDTGKPVEVNLPVLQMKIAGTGGITNTNNGVDFTVPYNSNNLINTTYYSTSTTGATQGQVTILKTGRYLLQARYSTFDLFQPSLPTIDGTKFLRITATVNGAKTCVLHNLLISTSVNGEAVASGSGVMTLAANDVLTIDAFHTGATGGNGSQGFPVTNNNLFNESMLWLVKIG